MEILVDTSGWIAWRWEKDARHGEAERVFDEWNARGARWVTTSCIMFELCGGQGRRPEMRREAVAALYDDIRSNPRVEVVHVDRQTQERAFDTYFKPYRDKTFSLVDCKSFCVMKQRGISHVVTTDDHFRQVNLGLQLLLEPEHDA